MTVESLRLELAGASVLEVITGSGRVEVTANGEPGVVTVEGLRPPRRGRYRRTVRREGKRWVIQPRRGSRPLIVRCPAGLNVTVGTRSGGISIHGPLGEVRASANSGAIEVEAVASLDARARSGRIEVRDCEGQARLGVVSGRVVVDRAGSVRLLAVSGKVRLREIVGKVEAMAVSGSVDLQSAGDGDISIATISGDIRIELPEQTRPQVHIQQGSGKLRNDLPAGDDVCLRLRAVSGDISVGPA